MLNDKLIRKYAHTLATLGMNVQKGQDVMIEACIENHKFAKILLEECYKVGANKVSIVYLDLELSKIESKYLKEEDISSIKEWEKKKYEEILTPNCCTIRLESENPKLLEDVNDSYSHAIFAHVDNLRNIMRGHVRNTHKQWCIAIVPTQAWAEVVLPRVPKEKALEEFWNVLFKLCLIDEESDPIENWNNKLSKKAEIANKIDDLELVDLHFTSSNGTDLHVGLTSRSRFGYRGPLPKNYIRNMANFPTEEICTTPHKYKINGKVCTTKPLALGGKVIPYFELTFKNGKVVDIKADECYDLLKKTIETDEGSCYLGEVALVAYHSPISMSGLVYYTTLIDENASCHLALGRALGDSSYIDEEGVKCFNDSSIHIDFMVGAKDTNIVGTTKDGRKVQIFKDGDFAL